MNAAIGALLAVAGLIHLLPLSGLLGADALQRLYGIDATAPELLLLLRHRAVLFGLLGAALLLAIRHPGWRWPAIGAGLLSTIAFLLLAGLPGQLNAPLQRVWYADVLALTALMLAAGLMVLAARRA